jgi:hypothetical protein
VKRSRSIRLVLISGVSAGALAGCGPPQPSPLSSEAVYTNNCYVPGVGYYHAPFRAWFSLPYNHFDPKTQRYFFGGQWAATACQTITNISSPTSGAAQLAEARRSDVVRGGFGGTGGSYWVAS